MSAPPALWSHVALNCRDQAVTEVFYTRHLGFHRARAVELGDDTRVVFLRRGAALLELFGVGDSTDGTDGKDGTDDGPTTPGTVRHIAFQTDDVDAVLASMGDEARITLGPLSFDAFLPGWRTVWLLDPDGVVVEVSQGFSDDDPYGTHGPIHGGSTPR